MSKAGGKSNSHRVFVASKLLIGGFLVGALTIATLYGCQSLRETMADKPGLSAVTCGVVGTGLGAAAGSLISKKDPATGAIIAAPVGAVVAAATCFTVAKLSTVPVKDYQQTAEVIGYQPTQGTRVVLQSLRAEPSPISAGQKITVHSDYAVMTQEPKANIKVVETITVRAFDDKANQWKEWQKIQNEITTNPQTLHAAHEILMPKEQLARRYQFVFQAEHNKVSDQKSLEVPATVPQASLPKDSALLERQSAAGDTRSR